MTRKEQYKKAKNGFVNWKKSAAFKKLKERLWNDQLGSCAICGSYMIGDNKPTVDHIVPLKVTLKHDPNADYQLVCKKCNELKDNTEEFCEKLRLQRFKNKHLKFVEEIKKLQATK